MGGARVGYRPQALGKAEVGLPPNLCKTEDSTLKIRGHEVCWLGYALKDQLGTMSWALRLPHHREDPRWQTPHALVSLKGISGKALPWVPSPTALPHFPTPGKNPALAGSTLLWERVGP